MKYEQPTDIPFPNPPKWLDQEAVKLYEKQAEYLDLHAIDWSVLATWSQAQSDVARLTEVVREEGEVLVSAKTGASYPNPSANALASAHKRASQSAKELGFGPIARRRIQNANIRTEVVDPIADIPDF